MAIIPKNQKLTNSSRNVLNAIRNSGSADMKHKVPEITDDTHQSLRQFGKAIMDYPSLQNEFIDTLVNRIAKVVIYSRMYYNNLAMFKKGLLEFGEIVEEIYVGLIDPEQYDISRAEKELWKMKFPDVKTAFHVMNYRVFYKVTILDVDLQRAFTTWDGVDNLIAKIIEQIYASAEYDEQNATKYLIASALYEGTLKTKQMPQIVDTDTAEETVIAYRADSNDLTFMDDQFNYAQVPTHTPKENQRLIVSTKYEAVTGVKVLAKAFNMSEVDYPTRVVLINDFGKIDYDRLFKCYSETPDVITVFPDWVHEELSKIGCILLDEDYLQIYDNYYKFTEDYNGQAMGWQYFYHVGKTFSVSPFKNALAYIDTEPSVTSIKVTPSSATATVGMDVQLYTDVSALGFADKTVLWSTSDDSVATVNVSGNVKCLSAGSVTITATSKYDTSKTAACELTIVEPGE